MTNPQSASESIGKNSTPTVVAAGIVMAVLTGGCWLMVSRGGLPGNIRSHFQNLKQVECCTIRSREIEESETKADLAMENWQWRIGRSSDCRNCSNLALPGTDRLSIRTDRENNTRAVGCSSRRPAIRDPGNGGNYLLICFECF